MWIPAGVQRAALRVQRDRGAVATEYALLAALIAVVIVVAVVFFGGTVLSLFDEVASSVSDLG